MEGVGGVVWSVSPDGFHTNLVVLEPGRSIAAHRNDTPDVLLVVLAGGGTAEVDDETVALATAVHVPRGSVRAITAGSAGVRYLTVHAQRGSLTKVLAVHGERHPELDEVRLLVAAVRADLEPHPLKEERVQFPAIHTLADGHTEFASGR